MLEKKESVKGNKWQLSISLASLILSFIAIYISYEVWNDTRRLSGLELSPDIRFFDYLHKSPPEFTIYNKGPVEAVQLEVDQLWHLYRNGRIGTSVSLGENRYKSAKVAPQEKVTIPFDKTLLYNIGVKVEAPIQNYIVEIRITYRRPSDKKLFLKSAFFFNNPAGHLVRENDISLEHAALFYETLKSTALKNIEKSRDMMPWVDLHSTEIN